jgi:TolB-like protein/Flp pilus assembly protein TadD
MGDESLKPASAPTGAVFLSYASDDIAAAERIANALGAAGIEVWFDKSELRGGDAWDRQIREQIHDCRLFIPVISANSERRDEGYFRREWSLAADRTRDMAYKRAFLVPVVIDGTPERGASVPDKFHELQWTRLPDGETPPAFVERLRKLLSPGEPGAPAMAAARGTIATTSARQPQSPNASVYGAIAIALLACVYVVADKIWPSKHATARTEQPSMTGGTTAAFNPPSHSIAVLPFVNMSEDKEQEYFSEGLTEELLNSLAEIEGLQVAARTSSFSFKEHPDITTVAHKLNVGAVLEGSVRRSGNTVRVTTQLINAVTGFHLWSHTYDRDLGDVLKLQSDIADAVARALKVALLGDAVAKFELGGTRNPAAFDAYLRGAKAQSRGHDARDLQAAIDAFTDAIRLDSNYALAYAARSYAVNDYAGFWTSGVASIHEGFERAVADGRQAILIAPELGEAHRALANALESLLDLQGAQEEYNRAVALAPGNARVLRDYGIFSAVMGRTDAGVAAIRHVVTLDPLNRDSHLTLGNALTDARKFEAAIAAFNDALALDSEYSPAYAYRGLAQYALGDFKGAVSSCEMKTGDFVYYLVCLAIAYDKLGRHNDAEAMLTKLKMWMGDGDAFQYAEIYAQWGNMPKALEWLDTAIRLRDAGLSTLKSDVLMDPLRKEPRFQAVMRELKFPD